MRSVMDRRFEKWLGILALGLGAAARLDAADADPQVASVLRSWEATSEDRGRDGLTVRTLQSFLGPLREDTLQERFTWSFCSQRELEAIPTDPAERQFLPSLRITIGSDGQPESVVIGKVTHDVRDLERTEIMQIAARESIATDNGIVRASFNPEGDSKPASSASSARISEVITRWIAASKSANAVRANFRRIDYDSATEVESHAAGAFTYCAPYQGIYHFRPTSKLATDSSRIGLTGERYVQLPSQETLLLWSDGNLTQVDVPDQRYEVHALPGSAREFLCSGSFDAIWQTLIAPQSTLPMVVGLQEKELRANYKWELVADDKLAVILHGTPRSGTDSMLYRSAQIVIDPASFRTRATRLIDASGTKETVHRFSDYIISKDIATLGKWQPDLSALERVGDVPGIEAASFEEEVQPASEGVPEIPTEPAE